MKNLVVISVIISIIINSCSKGDELKNTVDLNKLPTDTNGIHTAKPLNITDGYYGYYVYTPSVYFENGPQYPLLLFLHGSGEKGDSSNDPAILDLVLRNGPPKLIEKNNWRPKFPMVVVSPQAHDGGWNSKKLHEFIKYLINNYEINQNRIYLTGLSMGGYGAFNYLTTTGDSCYAAAAVPICGGGNPGNVKGMKHIPLWAFHGDADNVVPVSNSITMVDAINASKPAVKAKLTLYPGVEHNSWTKTYDGTGIGTEHADYDEFNMNIYDWMFQYEWKQFYSK